MFSTVGCVEFAMSLETPGARMFDPYMEMKDTEPAPTTGKAPAHFDKGRLHPAPAQRDTQQKTTGIPGDP